MEMPRMETGDHNQMEKISDSFQVNQGQTMAKQGMEGVKLGEESRASIREGNKGGKDTGKSPSIYVGQWDAIKEKMVWDLMSKEKDPSILGGSDPSAKLFYMGHAEGLEGLTKPCQKK